MSPKISSSEQISITKAKFVEINAVAGSGKTTTAIMRLDQLVRMGIPAEQIRVLSFSNAATKELQARMTDANSNLAQVTVSTGHAFAKRFVPEQKVLVEKQEVELLSKAIKAVQKFCLKSKAQGTLSTSIYKRRMKLLNVLGEQQNLKYVLSFLAVARAAAVPLSAMAAKPQFADLVPYLKALEAVRKKYSAIKKKRGVVDFGDMLSQATDAIRAEALIPYRHILVDEYQDCSPAQVQLLVALANRGCNIMVFGDPGQAIYGFGGSSYTPLGSVLDGVEVHNFPRSHRLTVENAVLASAITGRKADQAIKASRHGPLPAMVNSTSELEQAERIVDDIEQLLATGTPPRKIAVLGRVKALLQPVEQLLLTRRLDSVRLQVSRDKKHAIRVLRLVNLVGRSQKQKQKITVSMLQQALPTLKAGDKQCKDAVAAMNKVQRTPSLEGRYRLCGKVYLGLMGGMRKNSGCHHDLNRWEPLCRAYSSAKRMRDALRAIPADAVVTGTIHAAKGLEWDHVFVVGATNGYLPLYHAKDKSQLGEERNLLYVAVTRARESVRLYHAPCNHARSRQRFEDPCSFLSKAAVRKTLQAE